MELMSVENENVSTSRFKKRWIIWGAFVTITLVLGFMLRDYVVPSTWNYKVTVQIDTPKGMVEGHSISQLSNRPKIIKGYNTGNPAKYRGQAVVVNLPTQKRVFALISPSIFYKAFPHEGGVTTRAGIKYHKRLKAGIQIESINLPMKFVYFEDDKDARSLKVISRDEFSTFLGEGVTLSNIIVEKTKKTPERTSIENKLPANIKSQEFWEWLSGLEYSDPRRLSISSFK